MRSDGHPATNETGPGPVWPSCGDRYRVPVRSIVSPHPPPFLVRTGALMECLLPPCRQAYPLWTASALFATNVLLALRLLRAVGRAASRPSGDGLLWVSMGVAVVNVALDTHYAHLIPHAGTSLNMLMYSDVPVAEQALSPFLSVFLSMAVMGLNVLTHRALTDLDAAQRPRKED